MHYCTNSTVKENELCTVKPQLNVTQVSKDSKIMYVFKSTCISPSFSELILPQNIVVFYYKIALFLISIMYKNSIKCRL